jgi:hypothetical protein
VRGLSMTVLPTSRVFTVSIAFNPSGVIASILDAHVKDSYAKRFSVLLQSTLPRWSTAERHYRMVYVSCSVN